MRFRIFHSTLVRPRRAQLIAVLSGGALFCLGLPLQAQVGSGAGPGVGAPGIGSGVAPVVGPAIINAPPMRVAPRNIDQSIRGVRAPATTSSVSGSSGELSGTFVADVSNHVRADFSNLTVDLRKAIDHSQGNVREKLISINDRISDISGNLVDRAKETKDQARDRLGEVRTSLNEIHNDLTTLAGSTMDDAKQRIVIVRDRVDTLRTNIESATESRFHGTLGRAVDKVQTGIATAEDRARSVAANVQNQAQQAVGTVEKQVANVVREQIGPIAQSLGQSVPGTEIDHHQQGKLGVTVRQGATALTVTSVFEGSAAAKIGLQVGDQILAINRHRIINHRQLVSELAAAAQGDGNALVMIRRNGRTQELTTNVADAAHGAQPTNAVR